MLRFKILPSATKHMSAFTSTATLGEALEHYRVRCFWWVAPTVPLLNLSRDTLVRGLRTYGGWEGMRLAARL